MNKRMIVMITLVAVVSLMPSSAETLEVRGNVIRLDYAVNPELVWNAANFAGFWYNPDDDLMTEELRIDAYVLKATLTGAGEDRTIDEDHLWYTTSPAYQEYELHENEGLAVGSGNPDGDTGYWIEGFMAEEYVAIDGNADKLSKRLVEFEDDNTTTLVIGERYNLSGGFALELTDIDDAREKATIRLFKDGDPIEGSLKCIDTGTGNEQDRVYTYTADIGGEVDIPVCSCYVDEISGENDTIRIKYLFLIDDDVMEIETSDTYGVMEVMTASKTIVTLRNNERPLDLDTNTVEQIMGDMYFKTADNAPGDNQIRFYPMVECTEPGTYEMRGNVINLHDATSPELAWNATNFAAFWYDLDDDLMTEELRIDSNVLTSTPTGAGEDRTIDEDSLWYATSPVFQEYELHENEPDPDRDSLTAMEAEYVDYTSQNIGLCVESDRPGGDCGYFIEGWMGEKYVAIDGKADKLTKLLVEFEDDEYMILFTGKKWDLGGGFALELMGINDEGDAAMLQLSKNNVSLYIDCVSVGGGACRHDRVYTYRKDVAGEKNIPIFSCYVDAVFKGDISCVRVMYAFLIDDEVQVIKTRQTYGAMEVMTANSMEIILKNDETAIDLDPGTTKNITENMYFRIVNETSAIRFYPFVERTIGGEEPTPPPATIPATDSDHDGVPDVWDADNSTPSDYWVNSDGIGRKWGDMNGDGELTSADALMILQAAVGKIELG